MRKWIPLVMFVLAAGPALACDICATHIALSSWETPEKTTAAVSEQYSKYDPSAGDHEFESYITQAALLYRFSDRWAVQFTAPYLHRTLEGETEDGLGDVSLLGLYRVWNNMRNANVTFVDAYIGLKMPTGDSGLLKEDRDAALESEENHEDGDDHEHHHAEGHHLALGSGSWDGMFGGRGLIKRGLWQGLASAQYTARTEGDYDFQFGNELILSASLRYYALLNDQHSLAVGADLSRDWQDTNQVLGHDLEEGEVAASYVGPALDFTQGDRLTFSAGWDIAIEGENQGLQGAADKRLRASMSYMF